jgi:alpha-amylase/alpha-mannosidase (GH57 family)
MLLLKEKYPKIKATFNMVPSLVRQLEEYGEGNTDTYLDLSLKPAEELNDGEKLFILRNFFKADFRRKISNFPRYVELYTKRYSQNINENLPSWTDEDIRDVQLLFNLAWIDPLYYDEYPELRQIRSKGRNFSQDDVLAVINVQMKIMERLIKDYKKANENGEVDLIFSPYYHPILPLIYDTRSARRARQDVTLPNLVFSEPGDVELQLRKGWKQHTEFFGKEPKGFWPSEESVSREVLEIASSMGIAWAVTDEHILARTLGFDNFARGYKDVPEQAGLLYRPYKLELGGKTEITMVFRDQVLSDLIGFEYSKWSANDAVNDFMSRLETIYQKVKPLEGDYLVTVALDGENCWEYYENDGYDFLSRLYEALSGVDWITTETISNFIEEHDNFGRLSTLQTGSWINANFDMWIGDHCKNKAWDYLNAVRMAADLIFRRCPKLDEDIKDSVMEQLLIAEGSDWFWWYGKPNESDDKPVFDELFRKNLKKVYTLLDETVPPFLDEPIISGRC